MIGVWQQIKKQIKSVQQFMWIEMYIKQAQMSETLYAC